MERERKYGEDEENALMQKFFDDLESGDSIKMALEGNVGLSVIVRVELVRLVARERLKNELAKSLDLHSSVDLDFYVATIRKFANNLLPSTQLQFLDQDLEKILDENYFLGLDAIGVVKFSDATRLEISDSNNLLVSGNTAKVAFEESDYEDLNDQNLERFFANYGDELMNYVQMIPGGEISDYAKRRKIITLIFVFAMISSAIGDFWVSEFGPGKYFVLACIYAWYLKKNNLYNKSEIVNRMSFYETVYRTRDLSAIGNVEEALAGIHRYIISRFYGLFDLEEESFDEREKIMREIQGYLFKICGLGNFTLPEVEGEDIVQDEEVEGMQEIVEEDAEESVESKVEV